MIKRIAKAGLLASLVLILLLAALFAAHSFGYVRLLHEEPFEEKIAAAALPSDPRTDLPDIVLIILDTVRFDELLDPETLRPRHPSLAAVAAESRVYRHAYATSCWTVPSHVSMASGLYPNRHRADQKDMSVGTDFPVLPELLAGSGYFTAALMENPMLGSASGFARGYALFDDTFKRLPVADEDEGKLKVVPELVSALAGAPRLKEAPWFLLVNVMDAHWPYTPSERLYDPSVAGVPYRDLLARQYGYRLQNWYLGGVQVDERNLRNFRYLYRLEVAQAAEKAARIVETLARERPRRRVVIIASDHGESLGDHGHWDHVFHLGAELVRVPLLVFGDGVEPGIVDEPTSIADIFPTVLGLAGVDPPPSSGADLLGPLSAGRPIFMSYEYPYQVLDSFASWRRDDERLRPYLTPIRGVVLGKWKLTVRPGAAPELFDLESDPGEKKNLAGSESKKLAELTALLDTYVLDETRPGKAPMPKMDAKTKKALRSLGYLN